MAIQPNKISVENPACRYGTGRTLPDPLSTVVQRLTSSLEAQGFEIAFRLDYAEKFSKAGAIHSPPYQIWGISHLKQMSRALSAEPSAGLLFPYHLILFCSSRGETVIMVKDPARIMDLLCHPVAIEVAMEIGDMLERVLDEL